MLNVRDEEKDNEIISIKRATTRLGDDFYDHGHISGPSQIKVKNKIENNFINNSDVMKSDIGQTLVLEYIAPRRSCRVNIKITAFANGKERK